MTELKLMQLRHEINTWKRMLGFMQEENIHLKNRLSDVLKDRFDKSLLDGVEGFQTNFIKEDEVISYLKKEVAEVEYLLQDEIVNDEQQNYPIIKRIENIKKHLDYAERDFAKINNEFNNYLSENL